MSNLLETVLEAHGGLDRWSELDSISARLVQGGALWTLKGQQGVLDDVFVRASLHQERESHHPFGTPDRRSSFTPERMAIEMTSGSLVEALDEPRASFTGHALETPWAALQLAYFVGTAMWTYPTQPFTFALPGFETTELDPWHKAGEEWRRLHVAWPSYLATHCAEQTLYIGADGLFRRHDYDIDIAGGTSGATTARGYPAILRLAGRLHATAAIRKFCHGPAGCRGAVGRLDRMLGRSPASPRSTPISRLPLTPLGPIVVPAGRRSYPPMHSASGRSRPAG
jgi:hypothetical protein